MKRRATQLLRGSCCSFAFKVPVPGDILPLPVFVLGLAAYDSLSQVFTGRTFIQVVWPGLHHLFRATDLANVSTINDGLRQITKVTYEIKTDSVS